jgi:uncharacterized protein
MIVLFDANAAIPLALPRSLSSRLYHRLLELGHKIAVSPLILAEIQDRMSHKPSLQRWLRMTPEQIQAFFERLPNIATVTAGNYEISDIVSADPNDDHVIAAAIESKASFIVTEDKHLLRLNSWRGIQIVDRATML